MTAYALSLAWEKAEHKRSLKIEIFRLGRLGDTKKAEGGTQERRRGQIRTRAASTRTKSALDKVYGKAEEGKRGAKQRRYNCPCWP